jgi:hypothetical protein
MLPLPDDRALKLLADCFGDSSRPYFWETVQEVEWSGARPVVDFLVADGFDVIFDPNGATMPSRIEAARHFGRDDAPLGYQLSRAELIDMSHQVSDADFYVFTRDGSLCALRTHEDSDYGFWISTPDV